MKTTLDLPDDLLEEARSTASRRRTTLKALIVQGLRRELQCQSHSGPEEEDSMEIDEEGILCLKRRGAAVSSEMIYQMMEDEGT